MRGITQDDWSGQNKIYCTIMFEMERKSNYKNEKKKMFFIGILRNI